MRSTPSPHDHNRSSQHAGSGQRTQATNRKPPCAPPAAGCSAEGAPGVADGLGGRVEVGVIVGVSVAVGVGVIVGVCVAVDVGV